MEMFLPEAEFPTPAVEVALAALGVSCRRLHTASARLSGFTMKAAALLLSSFEEVSDSGGGTALRCRTFECMLQG